jgi:Ca2+-binding RTX toxin-like protein
MVHEWKKYPAPFDTERIRDVRRYDDIDLITGNDTIHGGSGNDILHGQRGDDTIQGNEGDDELYGELGHDELHGGDGNDIIIGDVGYAVRRYTSSRVPITKSRGGWKKDIVLEEIGSITHIQRLSQKFVVGAIDAELIAESSIVFVATAYNESGGKYVDQATGEWITDLFTFQLEEEYNDIMYGGAGDDGKIRHCILVHISFRHNLYFACAVSYLSTSWSAR